MTQNLLTTAILFSLGITIIVGVLFPGASRVSLMLIAAHLDWRATHHELRQFEDYFLEAAVIAALGLACGAVAHVLLENASPAQKKKFYNISTFALAYLAFKYTGHLAELCYFQEIFNLIENNFLQDPWGTIKTLAPQVVGDYRDLLRAMGNNYICSSFVKEYSVIISVVILSMEPAKAA